MADDNEHETKVPAREGFGWLVEQADSSPATPLYLGATPAGLGWTPRHHEALRLAREEDAHALWRCVHSQLPQFRADGARFAEHHWA